MEQEYKVVIAVSGGNTHRLTTLTKAEYATHQGKFLTITNALRKNNKQWPCGALPTHLIQWFNTYMPPGRTYVDEFKILKVIGEICIL